MELFDLETIRRYMGLGAWILLGLLIATLIERVRPARRYADYWPKLFLRDLGWFAFVSALSKVVNPTVTFLTTQLAAFNVDVWHDHVVLQVITFMLLGDFFVYWIHRAMHSYSRIGTVFWPTHRWHHETTTLTALSGYQGSLMHRLLFAVAAVGLPAILVDIRSPVAWTVITALHVGAQLFVHSNTNLHLGPLSWLFVTPAYHRVHHARDARLQASNLGTFFTLWDRLFGTYVPPHELRDLPLGTDEPRRNRIAVVIGA